jgi:CBS-domain-containing membrane protein
VFSGLADPPCVLIRCCSPPASGWALPGVLLLLTVVGFLARWGIRFRLVGVTSFTVLLSLSCLAFAVSLRATHPGGGRP